MPERIYLSPPHMGGTELEYIKEAFDSNWISPTGPNIERFEKLLGEYIGVKHCAALSSGTAALHLALIILGVSRGDEVICSSFTFAGSVNPVLYLGAKPIFIDSEKLTWNMDPYLLEEAIKTRLANGIKPKAIILVHLYGMPAQLEKILEISAKYEIPLIEDAAEALGAEYNKQKVGSFGHLSVVSFNGNKIITTSGGGALFSHNKEYIDKAKFLSTQARDPFLHYEHSQVGYNYRLSNICAGIGIGQMKVLDHHVKARRENFTYYKSQLQAIDEISFLEEPAWAYSNRWLSCIIFRESKKRDLVMNKLENENIESRPLWKPMHKQPVFMACLSHVNGVSQELFEYGLCLPSGSHLEIQQKKRIISVIKSCLN